MPPRRLALLIATYRYEDAGLRQLTAPGHDAEALAEVLRDPEIANFDVTILINQPHHVVGNAIGEFYRNRRRDDLTLLYFTGHGLKDDHGRLYLAMTNTKRDDLLFTGLSAQQIDEAMESCSSRQKVLVLDCCYSGAFPAGRVSKADGQVHTLEKFQGKGRVVLTASDATQYSFEGNHIIGEGTQSVFTRSLVKGLTTGEADLDDDGDISIDELYSYVHDRVIEEMPQQRPKKLENIEGRIVVARNIHWSLPTSVRNALENPLARERLVALEGLAQLHRIGNDLVRAKVIHHTRRLIQDDSKAVSAAAMTLITALNPDMARREAEEQARQEAVDQARREVEEQARQDAEEQARREAEEQAWREEQAQREANVQAWREEQAQREANLQARREEQAQREANVQAWREEQARRGAEEQARRGAEEQARREAEMPRWEPAVSSSPRQSWAEGKDAGAGPFQAGVTNGGRRWQVLIAIGALLGVIIVVVFVATHRSLSGSTPAPEAAPTARPAAVARPTVIATIEVGKPATFVAVSPNGRHAYVANSDIITVVDTATNRVTATVPIEAGPPQFLAVAPDSRTLYVSIFKDQGTIGVIDVIDTASNKVTATIPQSARPFLPAVSPDGKRLFVPNHDTASVVVVATDTNEIITSIPVAPDPICVAFSPDGSRAYTTNRKSNQVSVIDTATLNVLTTIPVGTSPESIAVHPDRPLVANVNTDGKSVSEIDTNTLKVVATIPVENHPRGISWAPDGRFAYVVNERSNAVSVIDATTNQITATIPTDRPTSIAVLPNGQQAYVSNYASGTLTLLKLTD